MIAWDMDLEIDPFGPREPTKVTHVLAFHYNNVLVHMLEFYSVSRGKPVTFFRTDDNKHIALGNDSLWCSGVLVRNKVPRLHKSVYADGVMDDRWLVEDLRDTSDDEVGVFWKIGEEITYESLI